MFGPKYPTHPIKQEEKAVLFSLQDTAPWYLHMDPVPLHLVKALGQQKVLQSHPDSGEVTSTTAVPYKLLWPMLAASGIPPHCMPWICGPGITYMVFRR